MTVFSPIPRPITIQFNRLYSVNIEDLSIVVYVYWTVAGPGFDLGWGA